MTPFLMASTSSIAMQSLGNIVQRASAVAACLFVCFFFVGHAPSPEHCAVQRCIVRTKALRCRLLPDFDAVFSLFSHGIAISDTLHSSHFCHCGVRWRHNTAPNLEPRSLVNFVPVSGRIAWPIMHRFGHFFWPNVLYNALNISEIRL